MNIPKLACANPTGNDATGGRMMDVKMLAISQIERWRAVEPAVTDGRSEPAGARIELAKCPALASRAPMPRGAAQRGWRRRGRLILF